MLRVSNQSSCKDLGHESIFAGWARPATNSICMYFTDSLEAFMKCVAHVGHLASKFQIESDLMLATLTHVCPNDGMLEC